MLSRSSPEATEAVLQDFYQELQGYSVAPLWNAGEQALVSEPKSKAVPHLWRWQELRGSKEMMDVMDEIYSILVTVDFPEGVTGGLRRNTDQMRGVLERTRGDLTMALRQHKLEARLASWEETQASND